MKKGSKHTPEAIKKQSLVKMGKKHSQETIKKRTAAISGSNNYGWKGGVSKDKDYRRTQYQKWLENPRNYKRKLWLNLRRDDKKRNNGGSHTQNEWENLKAQYNWTCPCCSKTEPETRLTRDHIIPISRGGSDNIENIQPLCRSCNSKKFTSEFRYVL